MKLLLPENILALLLKQEDTDNDKRITVEDKGPQKFILESEAGPVVVEGTYFLSNLLQEIILAGEANKSWVESELVFEKPADRISRMIKHFYWDGLTRSLDEKGLMHLINDSKSKSNQAIIYIPYHDQIAFDYFSSLKHKFDFEIFVLPEVITPAYVSSINDRGGILALALQRTNDEIHGKPFLVPGARFNEMYGWDSYFENIGLLIDGKIELAQSMVENFAYQIQHYGKILNANRSYYLTRTQPPLYTSMIREVFEKMVVKDIGWLKNYLSMAIYEYENVWMVEGKRLTRNGLNRYFAEGIGLPPETEAGHYDSILKPFAACENLSISEYEERYYQRRIQNTELDNYFVHDRSVRESGHDTSYRLEGKCADLNPVELNSFLYKYETDFSWFIKHFFKDELILENRTYTSDYWLEKANRRKERINQYMWSEVAGNYFDYNHIKEEKETFLAATCLFPLWAKIPTTLQAKQIVDNIVPKLIQLGGVSGCDLESLTPFKDAQMERQWDYPNGWPPHQMIIWKGLLNYGYEDLTQQLVYRWLWMITKNASDYNGTIPEKFNVVTATHKVFAEYGNQGTEFEYITREGFGWMNASFQLGLQLLNTDLRAKLNDLIHPDYIFKNQ